MSDEILFRTRYGEVFWRAHHEAWHRSELNQREYCEAQRIPLKAFGNWRAKFKAEPQPPGDWPARHCWRIYWSVNIATRPLDLGELGGRRLLVAGAATRTACRSCVCVGQGRDQLPRRHLAHGGAQTDLRRRTRCLGLCGPARRREGPDDVR